MATPPPARQPGMEVFTSRPSSDNQPAAASFDFSRASPAPSYAYNESRPDVAPVQDINMPASALAGLTIHQMVDLDVEGLAVKIDDHHCRTKKAVLDHFMDIKMRLLASQAAAVDEERRAGNSRLDAKQAEVDLLKAELMQGNGQNARQAEVIGRLLTAFDKSKHRTRTLGLLHRAFRGWCHYTFVSRRAKQRMQRAEQWHSKELLQRRVLREWFRVAMQMHRVTLHNKYLSDLQQARADMAVQYEGQLDALRGQLVDTRRQLLQEAAAREKLEESMKQAFMRGVCALNIEAMSIMNRGMPPGGANPAPLPPGGRGPSPSPGGPGVLGGPAATSGATGMGAPRSATQQEAGLQQQRPLAPGAVLSDLEPRAALQVAPSHKSSAPQPLPHPQHATPAPQLSPYSQGLSSAAGASITFTQGLSPGQAQGRPGGAGPLGAMARAGGGGTSLTVDVINAQTINTHTLNTQSIHTHTITTASPPPAQAQGQGQGPPVGSGAAAGAGTAGGAGSSTAQSFYQQRPPLGKVVVTRGPAGVSR